MMVNRIYFDESEDPDRYVLSGVIFDSDTNDEETFCEKWIELLPAIPAERGASFKASRLMKNPAQFELFNEFYSILEQSNCKVCSVSFDPNDYRNVAESLAWPFERIRDRKMLGRHLKNPYVFAFQRSLVGILRNGDKLGISRQLEPVFDTKTESKIVLPYWDYQLEWYRNYAPDLECSKPIFCSDEERVPLQAADMMAWLTRKWGADRVDWVHHAVPAPYPLRAEAGVIPEVNLHFTKEEIEEEIRNRHNRVLEEIERIDQARFNFSLAWTSP